jgi:NAD(P)-dependent dehydrogenase (short-subunit alcohol dehydrogenase family)
MGLLEAHAGLAGKVAVVVGGAREIIGRAVTLGLARAGVSIATCDIHEDAVAAIVPEVEAPGVRIPSVGADAGDPQALDAFYDEVEDGFGASDIVVNVVAGVKRSLLMNTTREDNVRDIRLNYGYVIDSCRRAIHPQAAAASSTSPRSRPSPMRSMQAPTRQQPTSVAPSRSNLAASRSG